MMLFARLIGLIIIRYSLRSMKRMGKVEEYEDSQGLAGLLSFVVEFDSVRSLDSQENDK